MRMRSALMELMMAGGLTVGLLGASSTSLAQSTNDDMRVTITLKDADMIAATKELTLKTGLNFVFEPSSEPYGKVTLQLNMMTPEEAIEYICKAAGATFRKDTNGVYIISHKKSDASLPTTSDVTPAPAPPPVAHMHMHKFKLMHEDAKIVYDYVTGKGAPDGYDAYRDMNKFMDVVQGSHTPKGPDSPIYMMGQSGANGTGSYQPVPAQQYSPPKTFTESGNDVSMPGADAAGQAGLGGGGGGFGGGGQGFGGGGFGGGGQGGRGGGGQFGGGGASFQTGQGLIPQVPYITYDPTDNSLVVQGTDEQIKQIQDAITFFDVAPQQVVIKVEFITTTNDFTSDLGFDWTYARGQVVAGAAPGFFTNQNAPIFFNWASGNIVSRLRAELNRDTGKAVQAPVVRTLNNEPAFVGEQILTWIFFNQTISIGNGNVITESVPSPLPITTFLTVRPRINNDGTITLFLNPQIQDISSFQTDPSGNQFPNTTAETIGVVARVKSGETIALAGFTRKSETGADQRFPILGELPIIGQLFRHTTHTIVNSELIIFVTPTVVEEDQGGLGP